MFKINVTKEQYDKVRQVEKISKRKIKDVYAPVVDCVEGQWGLWNINHCYQSLSNYIAEVELDIKADSYEGAVKMWSYLQGMALIQYKKGDSSVVGKTIGN